MFSIVMPVWNGRRTLRQCVERIFAQTFPDFELIVVDDGSTDDGIRTIESIADPRLKILRRGNGGAAEARNTGIRAARHDWIAFSDADDVWACDHLAELNSIHTRFPEAELIGTAFIHSDERGRYAFPEPFGQTQIELVSYFERVGGLRQPFWISSSAVSAPAVSRLGGFRPSRYGDDSEFLARLALEVPVAASSRVTAVWIHGTGGITDSSAYRWRDAALATPADIAPAVALVMERRDELGPEALPPGVDAFIDRYVGWCLRTSVNVGDSRTVRRLWGFYQRPPPLSDHLLLALGALPGPLLRYARRLAWFVARILRRVSAALLPAQRSSKGIHSLAASVESAPVEAHPRS